MEGREVGLRMQAGDVEGERMPLQRIEARRLAAFGQRHRLEQRAMALLGMEAGQRPARAQQVERIAGTDAGEAVDHVIVGRVGHAWLRRSSVEGFAAAPPARQPSAGATSVAISSIERRMWWCGGSTE